MVKVIKSLTKGWVLHWSWIVFLDKKSFSTVSALYAGVKWIPAKNKGIPHYLALHILHFSTMLSSWLAGEISRLVGCEPEVGWQERTAFALTAPCKTQDLENNVATISNQNKHFM